ncbi:hypothetical protein HYV57_05850 [Candidatus Peregrinibacteria bacterium]|nr:hypothetical protein [Candidatus Peregrinibacteria bacterium]
MLKLLKPSYIFDLTPQADFRYAIAFAIFFALVFAGGWALKRYFKYKKDPVLKKILKRFPFRFYGLAITGEILLFLRSQSIPLFSMRFFLLLLMAAIIVLIMRMAYLYKKIYPKEQSKHAAKLEKKKYLPH